MNGPSVTTLRRFDSRCPPEWSDWKADKKYSAKLRGKYSAGRPFAQSLACATILAAAEAWLGWSVPAPWPIWLRLLNWILRASIIGFGFVACLSAAAIFGAVVWGVWDEINCTFRSFVVHVPMASAETVVGSTSGDTKSPRIANYLLQLILPDRDRATLIGDLKEAYKRDLLPQYGTRGAAFWYWVRALREMAFYAWPTIKKLLPWGAIFATLASGRLRWLVRFPQQLLGQ
jgi:hypothetical protein